MTEKARNAEASSIEFVQIGRPFSNFDFIERRFGRSDTLPRLFSQVRCHGGTTMVVEELKMPAELKEENEDLRKVTGRQFRARATRLTFFTRTLTRKGELKHATDKDFIGYAIIKRDHLPEKKVPCHIYESVIRKSHHPNNFVRGEQSWECSAGDSTFTAMGFLYAQQNELTNVCAHAAVRTAAARFPDGKNLSYREMNRIVGIDHRTRKATKGLNSEEIARILESVGARCFVADFTLRKKPSAMFQRYIYGSIESGYPAIVFFGTADSHNSYHTIPVFGHTFNQDTWVPSADRSYFRIGAGTQYIPSDSWLSMFINHDDNWGSNLCIPRHYLQTKRHPAAKNRIARRSKSDVESVAFIIATVPKEVEVSPLQAEAIGADYLFTILPQLPNVNSNKWAARLARFASENQLVLRPLLITGREYTKHLGRMRDWRENRIDQAWVSAIKGLVSDRSLWMIELSVPELFLANKRKVGEVLLRADKRLGTERDLSNFIFARLPGFFALYQSGNNSKPKYWFIPSGADSHVQLYGCDAKP
jgi:hypothetical protein